MRIAGDSALQADRPDVIDETFDGEAVLVHLRTGCYYALDPTASAMWKALSRGRTPAAVADATAAHHGRPVAEELARLTEFAQRLADEELLCAYDGPAVAPPETADVEAIGAVEPELQRFTDMQDLLMLDPIHDIDLDGDGWPVGGDGARVEPAA